jgi:hypothetical protein
MQRSKLSVLYRTIEDVGGSLMGTLPLSCLLNYTTLGDTFLSGTIQSENERFPVHFRILCWTLHIHSLEFGKEGRPHLSTWKWVVFLGSPKEKGGAWGKALIVVAAGTAARRASVEDKKTLVDKIDAFIFDCDGEDRFLARLHGNSPMIVCIGSAAGQRGAQ